MSPDERQAVLDDMTLAFSLLFGVWFTFMGAVFALVSEAHAARANVGATYGVLEVLSGRYIRQRRRWLFSFIVSLPRVLLIPYYGKAQ